MTRSDRLNATFTALADPTRRAILARLAAGEASVMDLAKPFAMSQPAISKHLKVLERARLILQSLDFVTTTTHPRLAETMMFVEEKRRELLGSVEGGEQGRRRKQIDHTLKSIPE